MRADAAATIFSRNSAPPPPLMRLRSGAISSAPSTVRSSSGVSSKVDNGTPTRSASRRVASEVGTPDDLEAVAHALAEQLDEMLRRRAGAQARDACPVARTQSHERPRHVSARQDPLRKSAGSAVCHCNKARLSSVDPRAGIVHCVPVPVERLPFIAPCPVAIGRSWLPPSSSSISTGRWSIPRPIWSRPSTPSWRAKGCRRSTTRRRATWSAAARA